jgi:hypothetical protein
MSGRRTPAVASALAAITLLALLGPAPSQATTVRASHRVTGTTELLPPVVQPGRRVAAARGARLSGTVRFSPARRGRPVVLQRRLRGGPWRALATRRQGPRGVVAFTAKASRGGRPFTYRGVAPRYPRLAFAVNATTPLGPWRRVPRRGTGGSPTSSPAARSTPRAGTTGCSAAPPHGGPGR